MWQMIINTALTSPPPSFILNPLRRGGDGRVGEEVVVVAPPGWVQKEASLRLLSCGPD